MRATLQCDSAEGTENKQQKESETMFGSMYRILRDKAGLEVDVWEEVGDLDRPVSSRPKAQPPDCSPLNRAFMQLSSCRRMYNVLLERHVH